MRIALALGENLTRRHRHNMITYEEKELLKDDVLKYLQTTNGVYSPQIAEKLKQKIELIDYLIYQLKLDGYVYTHSLN